jgi:hypothetical protein
LSITFDRKRNSALTAAIECQRIYETGYYTAGSFPQRLARPRSTGNIYILELVGFGLEP